MTNDGKYSIDSSCEEFLEVPLFYYTFFSRESQGDFRILWRFISLNLRDGHEHPAARPAGIPLYREPSDDSEPPYAPAVCHEFCHIVNFLKIFSPALYKLPDV